jgi:hypothetical protein
MPGDRAATEQRHVKRWAAGTRRYDADEWIKGQTGSREILTLEVEGSRSFIHHHVLHSADTSPKSLRVQVVDHLLTKWKVWVSFKGVVKEIFCSTTKLSFWCRKITRKAFVSHQNPSPQPTPEEK